MRVEEWLGSNNLIGKDIWQDKYCYRGESFDDWVKRVSANNEELGKLIKERKFLFGGRALANRGTDKKGTMFNCYSSGYVGDSIPEIMQLNTNLALTYKAQGGQGVSLTKIRPKGTPIGQDYVSDGIIPFMELFNTTTACISQGGARKGALMMSIDIRHKEAETFITIKSNKDKITNANLSLEIDDEFMKAVKEYYKSGDVITLHEIKDYNGHRVEYDLVPIKLYQLMVQTVYDWGEPGCIFTNRFRNYNLMEFDDDYEIATCNPCLTGDTMIAVADGRNAVSIKDLCDTNFPIYSGHYSKNRQITRCLTKDKWVVEIKNAKAFKTGTKKVVTVVLSDGSTFRCTPDHRLGLVDGSYCEAKDCKGKQLGKFFTFSNKNTNKSYRSINSITFNRQYRMIADFNNLYDDENSNIHHIDEDSTNDLISNLKSISIEEHKIETNVQRENNNPIRRDINYKFNQGLKSISANGKRYGWSEDRILEEKNRYVEEHQDLYVEKVDNNVYLTDAIYVDDIIDDGIKEDVYDITVEDNHNFYIITKTDDEKYLNCSGVLVHNCGEQPLPANFSCNLGSLNVSEFIEDSYTDKAKFNFEEFKLAVRIAVRGLDDIIDENAKKHALKEQAENSKNYRNMGLGVFGYANALFKLGLTYGSEKARKFTDKLFKTLFTTAVDESLVLAINKGAFPKCKKDALLKANIIKNNIKDASTLEGIEMYGLRNCSLISIAPTGSIATMLGCSGGCEPEFSLLYYRRTINLKASYAVLSKSVKEYCELHKLQEYYDFEKVLEEQSTIIEELSTHLIGDNPYDEPANKPIYAEIGKCSGVIYEAFVKVKEKLPECFITSEQINWKDRVVTQAIMQHYVDTAISSTINLSQDTPIEEVEQIYLYAWELGLKGLTLFRSGCKRLAILTSVKKEEKKTVESVEDVGKEGYHSIKWGTRLPVRDDLIGFKTKVKTGCGAFHLEVFCDTQGRPWETFISLSDGGGCERNLEAISKLTSSLLRAGVPVEQVIETLKSVKPCVSFCMKEGTSKGRSCGSAVGFAFEELVKKVKTTLNITDEKHSCIDVKAIKEEIKEEKVEKHNEGVCPECGAEMTREGGCDVCHSCGYSHCG